jgi:GT2 family glycosyltransferase
LETQTEVNPGVSFIIVNWNGGDLLRRAVQSIGTYPPSVPYEVVVVDNASSDDSISWLRSTEPASISGTPKFILIENPTNVGFGAANNQGFAAASAPVFFLLNADAELRAGACDTLLSTLNSNARIGACGPRMVYPDGSLQISVWRNPPTAWATLVSGLRLYKVLPKKLRGELLLAEFWPHDRRRDVSMLSGAAILARRSMIQEVGGFDSRFHMYGEDNEWCLRVTRADWRIVFEPGAIVMHHGAQSSRQRWDDLERLRIQTQASFVFQRHCLTRSQFFCNLLANTALLWLQQTVRKLKRTPAQDVRLNLQLYLNELKSFLSKEEPTAIRTS